MVPIFDLYYNYDTIWVSNFFDFVMNIIVYIIPCIHLDIGPGIDPLVNTEFWFIFAIQNAPTPTLKTKETKV